LMKTDRTNLISYLETNGRTRSARIL
jgi:hypothetical protein